MKRATGRAVLGVAALSTFFLFKPMLKLQDNVKQIWHSTFDQKKSNLEHGHTQDSIFDGLEKSMDQMNEDTKKRADSLKNKTSSVDVELDNNPALDFEFKNDDVIAQGVDLGEGTLLITSLEASSQNKFDMGINSDGASIKTAPSFQAPAA